MTTTDWNMPKWNLSDLELAMNAEGIETPNHLSYFNETVYTHNAEGELIEMDATAQKFAQNWIANQP
jgi:hypothetical protein